MHGLRYWGIHTNSLYCKELEKLKYFTKSVDMDILLCYTISMATERTELQIERQEERYRVKGKYSKVNPCEDCGKSAGVNYYSLPNCNSTGKGVILCKKCVDKY